MPDVSVSQRSVSAKAPNLLSQTNGILQQLQGISVSVSQGGESLSSGIGHRTLFDTELFQANIRETKQYRADYRHKDSAEEQGYFKAKIDNVAAEDHSRTDKIDTKESVSPEKKPDNSGAENNQTESIAAAQETENSASDDSIASDKQEVGEVEVSAEGDLDTRAPKSLDSDNVTIGTAEEVLAAAQELLAQIEEFLTQFPALSQPLQAIVAPIQDSLEQLTVQLSGLDPAALVGPKQLGGQGVDAFARLEQFADLFNRQQQLIAKGEPGNLVTKELPEGFAQAIKSLSKAEGQALVKINQIAEAFRQLTPQNIANPEENLGQQIAANIKQAVDKPAANLQPQALSVDLEQVVQDIKTAASTETKQTVNNSNQNGGAQTSAGGNNSGAQQHAFANAQSQLTAQAQQAANSNVSSTRGESSSTSTITSSSPNVTSGQSGSGFSQTSVTLTREAASFEQALKQANRPSVGEQVQANIKSMVKDGTSKFIVKLDPPQLGELELRMQVNKNAEVKLIVTVERQGTLELLQRDSRMLMQALQDAGLQADGGSLSFNLQGGNDSEGDGKQQAKNVYPIAEEEFDEQMLSVASENYVLEINEREGVNIHA